MLLLCYISSRLCFWGIFWVPAGSKGLPGVPGYQGTHGLPGDPNSVKGQHGDPGAEGLPGIKGMPGLTGNRGISGFGGMSGYKVSRSLDGSSTKRSHRGLSPHPSLLPGSAGSVSVLQSTFADAGFPQQLYKLSSEAFSRKRGWIKYKSNYKYINILQNISNFRVEFPPLCNFPILLFCTDKICLVGLLFHRIPCKSGVLFFVIHSSNVHLFLSQGLKGSPGAFGAPGEKGGRGIKGATLNLNSRTMETFITRLF